jgi:solute carrier family 27 fatty acid transporter 1/4
MTSFNVSFLCRGAYRYVRLLVLMYYFQKCNLTVPQAFSRTVKRHENKACLIFEDQTWTFRDLENYSNRVANYFLRAGYKPGQCVALFMENRPEYVGLWLGCSKVGLVPALINSNLSGQPLLHSMSAASARALIYGSEFNEGKWGIVI